MCPPPPTRHTVSWNSSEVSNTYMGGYGMCRDSIAVREVRILNTATCRLRVKSYLLLLLDYASLSRCAIDEYESRST